MMWLKSSELFSLGALLSVLGAAMGLGEATVSTVVHDTARLPCWFSFVQGLDNLMALWEKMGKDGNNVQIYKIMNGRHDLSTQDSQYRGRTVLSGDISKGNLDLTLSWVTMKDDGVYFCRASNMKNHGDKSVTLSVRALPPQMIESVVGGEVTLGLKYNGDPSEIIWKLDTSKIVEKESVSPVPRFYRLEDRATLSPNGSLTIRDLRKEDSGVYKSEVLVENYIQETEIQLTVLDRVSKPAITANTSGPQIVLICQSSTANVTYRWLDKTRGETVSTEQEYRPPRPSESVKLVCTVNNSISEESDSITIPYGSDIGLSVRHRHIPISIIMSSLLLTIVIIPAAYCHKGFQKTKEDMRDITDHKHSHLLLTPIQTSSDRDYFCGEAAEGAHLHTNP